MEITSIEVYGKIGKEDAKTSALAMKKFGDRLKHCYFGDDIFEWIPDHDDKGVEFEFKTAQLVYESTDHFYCTASFEIEQGR